MKMKYVVKENYVKQPAYCRSLCTPLPTVIRSKKDQVLDAYLRSKKNQGKRKAVDAYIWKTAIDNKTIKYYCPFVCQSALI